MQTITSWLLSNDNTLLTILNRKIKCKFLDVVMPNITHLGGATFTITSLLFIILFVNNLLATEALVSLTISHIFVRIIKKIYGRKRPYIDNSNVNTFANPLLDYSFPSGHTTSSFAVAVTFALHSFLLGLFLVPIAIIIGISRIYLGLHYPTDVIVGALLGAITSVFVVQYFAYFL